MFIHRGHNLRSSSQSKMNVLYISIYNVVKLRRYSPETTGPILFFLGRNEYAIEKGQRVVIVDSPETDVLAFLTHHYRSGADTEGGGLPLTTPMQ